MLKLCIMTEEELSHIFGDLDAYIPLHEGNFLGVKFNWCLHVFKKKYVTNSLFLFIFFRTTTEIDRRNWPWWDSRPDWTDIHRLGLYPLKVSLHRLTFLWTNPLMNIPEIKKKVHLLHELCLPPFLKMCLLHNNHAARHRILTHVKTFSVSS